MNKMKQRKTMKTLAIVNNALDCAIAINKHIGVSFINCIDKKKLLTQQTEILLATPFQLFRADKPTVDFRRYNRYYRQLKSVKSFTLMTLTPDEHRIKHSSASIAKLKKDWEECNRGPRGNITILGIDLAKPGADRTTITRCVTTPGHVSPDFFDEQYMTHPDIENSEKSYLIDLHKKSGFDLPYGGDNCSLQSLRASYNFKAKKAGIETYKWTNK